MSDKLSRVPSAEQLTELLQAIVPFMNLNRYTSEVTWRQEDYALPLFVRLADALHAIRPSIDSIMGWPPRIESALRIVIESFDATAAAWGWEWVVDPERAAYINERKGSFLETVERPVYEAALSMQAGFRGLKRPRDVDDLADKGRDLGFEATMTPDEGEAQYPLACDRWHKSPRLGTCYPRIGEQEGKSLGGAYNLIAVALKTVKPPTDAPRLDGRKEPPKARGELTAPAPDFETVENRALAMALRMIQSGEKLSIAMIAKTLGCQTTFLYRCPNFQAFIKAHENGRKALPRGRKDRKTGDLEAWDSGD